MRRSSGEYCDLAPPTVAVVAPTELALVDALEKKHASLERKIVAAEASVRQKEVELHEKIAAAESRVGEEIERAATAERTAVRTAIEGVLLRLHEEETRRADLSTERMLAVAEREWRGALLETLGVAETEISRCCLLLETRAGRLVDTLDEQLAALAPDAVRAAAKVTSLAKATETVERTTSALASHLTMRVEKQLEENEEMMRSLFAGVSQAMTSAAEEQRTSGEAVERLEVAHSQKLDALRTDALGTYITYMRELKAADSALCAAGSAVEAALGCGVDVAVDGGDAEGEEAAAETVSRAMGEEDMETWVARGVALEGMRMRADALGSRCDALTSSWQQEAAALRLEHAEASARADRVESSLSELTPLVARLSTELTAHKEHSEALNAELASLRTQHTALELAHTNLSVAAEAQCKSAHADAAAHEIALSARGATEAALRSELLTLTSELDLSRREAQAAAADWAKSKSALASRLSASEEERTRLSAALAAANARAESLEGERARLEQSLAYERSEGCRVARDAAARGIATVAVARAQTQAVCEERDASRAEHARTAASLQATQQAMTAAAKLAEGRLDLETEKRVAAEAAHAAEAAARAEAEGFAFHAALKLRVVTRYPQRGVVDEIDAALAAVLHACALPRRLTVDRISRGWYWIGAAAGDGMPAGQPRRVNLILTAQGVPMVRVTASGSQRVQGVQTVHPVEYLLGYLDDLARAEDAAALAGADDEYLDALGWPTGEEEEEAARMCPPPKLTSGLPASELGRKGIESTVDGGDSTMSATPTLTSVGTPAKPRSVSWQVSSTASSVPQHLPWRANSSSTLVARGTPVHTFSIDDLRPGLGPRIRVAQVDLFGEADSGPTAQVDLSDVD